MKKLYLLLLSPIFSISLQAQHCWTKVENPPFVPILTGKVITADVDGDMDQDVLVTGSSGHYIGSTILYTNDGNGNFTEVEGTPFTPIEKSSAAFGDIDGDLDQDLIIVGLQGGVTRITKLYLNDGDGNFTEDESAPFHQVRFGDVAIADFDGDKDLDVLISGESSNGREVTLYRNDGSGNFTEDTNQIFQGVYYAPIAYGDVDGDKDLDVVVVGYAMIDNNSVFVSRLYFNDGNGNFTPPETNYLRHIADGDIAFSDVDKDGDLDLLMTGKQWAPTGISRVLTLLYTNDGTGTYTEAEVQPFAHVGAGAIAFGDIDNDEDEDVIISGLTGSGNTPSRLTMLYTNDGEGNFTIVENTPIDSVRYGSVAFTDVDGDDDIDLFVAGQDLLNNRVANLFLNCGGVITGNRISANEEITLYPNPTSGAFNIDLSQYPNARIRIMNTSGRIISEITNSDTYNSIYIQGPAGLYFVEVATLEKSLKYKVVKEN